MTPVQRLLAALEKIRSMTAPMGYDSGYPAVARIAEEAIDNHKKEEHEQAKA